MKPGKLSAFLICSALLIMILFPEITLQGACSGLLLWYSRFLPSVFPFLILSSLLTGYLKQDGPVFAAAAGFLNGYPGGAKLAADLRKRNLLPEETACDYAVFCNMSGPMFLASYAGLRQEMPVIYLTSILMLYGVCRLKKLQNRKLKLPSRGRPPGQAETLCASGKSDPLMECTAVMVKAGIYIMYFSILTEFLLQPRFSCLPVQILIPFLELTTGVAYIQSAAFPFPAATRYFLVFLCVSGGLCTAFQTMEVTKGLNLSLPRYLFLKSIQAAAICAACGLIFSY